MMNKVRIAALLAAVSLISVGAAHAQDAKSKLDEVLERGVLVMGTGSTNAPWHFKGADDKLQGFDVDMGRIVAKALFGDPDKIEFVNQASDARIPEHHDRQGRHHLPVHDRDRRARPANRLHHPLLSRGRWPHAEE